MGSIRLTSRAACLVIGGVLLALFAAAVPLSGLAHQNLNAGGGSVPVWVSAAFAAAGWVLAFRRPANPLGWIMLGSAFFFALSEDASYYTVADYGLRHGDLPLGAVALLAQPGWAPGIVLLGLLLLLFPDGRLPSSRWRWLAAAYAAVAALWMAGAVVLTVRALADHRTQVDSGGNLLLLSGHDPAAGWWNVLQRPVLPAAHRLLAGLDRQPGAQLPALVRGTPPAAEVAAGRVGRHPGRPWARRAAQERAVAE